MDRIISYAQNAEDVVLWRALGDRETPGFYIDIGANHPTADSVTRLFYERGWRGVNVEPQPDLHRALVEERPEDVNLNVGVSDVPGTMVLHVIAEADGLSTMSRDLLAMYEEQGRSIEDIDVDVLTLAQIVDDHAPDEVDFLKVDVEGHEREVLSSVDWARFRPRVVVVEATLPERWVAILDDARYRFAQFDGINNFYVREEDEDVLGAALRQPATVMDLYDPWLYVHQLQIQHDRIVALEVERDALAARLAETERAREAAGDVEQIAGRDLAKALGRRLVTRVRGATRGGSAS